MKEHFSEARQRFTYKLDGAMQFNAYLASDLATGTKGGGIWIEDPAAVENIRFQTRAGPLDAFEQAFSEQLMAVFGGGATSLSDVVSGLAAIGSRDPQGAAWSEDSLAARLASSAALLFAPIDGGARG